MKESDEVFEFNEFIIKPGIRLIIQYSYKLKLSSIFINASII